MVERHVEEMANLHLRTIEALALAIEAKDHTTNEHLQRVRVYAIEVGKELGVTGTELEALHAAALLHLGLWAYILVGLAVLGAAFYLLLEYVAPISG